MTDDRVRRKATNTHLQAYPISAMINPVELSKMSAAANLAVFSKLYDHYMKVATETGRLDHTCISIGYACVPLTNAMYFAMEKKNEEVHTKAVDLGNSLLLQLQKMSMDDATDAYDEVIRDISDALNCYGTYSS